MKRKRIRWFATLAVILVLFGAKYIQESQTPRITVTEGEMRVHFIDVGQADCSLIEMPDGKTMLIDAGNNDDGETVVDYLNACGIDTIDYLIGTHPHEDHIGGMDDVIENFPIGKIYMPKVQANTKTFRDVLTAVKNRGLSVHSAKAGVTLTETPDLSIAMLAPNKEVYEEMNDYSAVVRIVYQDTAFLFMGDAEKRSENEIKEDVRADVLKIGHHGSSSSTSEKFLRRVDPGYVFIPCGKDNDYGHPHREIRDLLKQYHITTYRADTDGTVVFASDGKEVWVVE